VRIPAAACGVVGLKPSPGRIARTPTSNGWNSLAVDGPLARTVRDVALLFGAMAGFDDRDPIALPDTGEDFLAACDGDLNDLKIAWGADFGYAPIETRVSNVAGAAARAFETLGCDVEADAPSFADPDELFRRLTGPARAAAFSKYLDEWSDQMDPILIERMQMADDMSAEDYERLMQERTALWRTIQSFFQRYDLLLTPTLAMAPFPITNPYPPSEVAGRPVDTPTAWFPFTFPFNLTGHPAITVPAGFTPEGLPVGLQIVGPRNAEALVLKAAASFEAVRPWAGRRPEL
jgi:aspartyl-tRNA(Asn)/glutamyl-tRNA(Gln) amidotransferase subunit A